MSLSVTVIICIITGGISLLAFNNRDLLRKLLMNPYQVAHHNEYQRVLTHGFIHADYMHLFFNLFVANSLFYKSLQYCWQWSLFLSLIAFRPALCTTLMRWIIYKANIAWTCASAPFFQQPRPQSLDEMSINPALPPSTNDFVVVVSASTLIDAPPDKIWSILMDFPNYGKWWAKRFVLSVWNGKLIIPFVCRNTFVYDIRLHTGMKYPHAQEPGLLLIPATDHDPESIVTSSLVPSVPATHPPYPKICAPADSWSQSDHVFRPDTLSRHSVCIILMTPDAAFSASKFSISIQLSRVQAVLPPIGLQCPPVNALSCTCQRDHDGEKRDTVFCIKIFGTCIFSHCHCQLSQNLRLIMALISTALLSITFTYS